MNQYKDPYETSSKMPRKEPGFFHGSFLRLWINTLALSKLGISKEAALQQKSLWV